jgi:hypothetical protein
VKIFTEAITAIRHTVKEIITAKLKQEEGHGKDSGPPAYREAV